MSLNRRRIPKSIHSASSRPVHAGRCRTVHGVLGCDTTGWQDQAEMTDTVIDEINHDSRFEAYVKKTWKKHARGLPSFLPVDHIAQTTGDKTRSHYDELVIATHCSLSSPFWDPKRAGRAQSGVACRLFTVVGFSWELRP